MDELFQKNLRENIAGQKQYYATSSSIYAENSILNPDIDKVLFCIAAMLQAQIFESAKETPVPIEKYAEFVIEPHLPTDEGGFMDSIPDHVLLNETLHDANLRDYILSGRVPTVHTIFRYINTIFDGAKFSPECNLIAMVYLHRLTKTVMLTINNFRGIWLGAVVLAQKMFDDVALRTGSFVNLLPGVTKAQLIKIERVFFCGIECSTNVSSSTYTNYYFALYQLFGDITRQQSGDPATATSWNLKPLSIARAKRITFRSSANDLSSSSSIISGGGNFSNGLTPGSSSSISKSNMSSLTSQFAVSPMKKVSSLKGPTAVHDSVMAAARLHATPRSNSSPWPSKVAGTGTAGAVANAATTGRATGASEQQLTPLALSSNALDKFIAERNQLEETRKQDRDRSYFYSGRFNNHTAELVGADGSALSATNGNFKSTPLIKHRTLEDVTIVDTSRFVIS